jgi:Mce-associated membrane protein
VKTDQESRTDDVDAVDAEVTESSADTLETDADPDTRDVTDSSTDPGDAPDGESDAVEAVERRRRPTSVLGIAVLAVMLVASGSVAAWLYFTQYHPNQQTGPAAEESALQAAKDGAVALLSYAPNTLDADLTAAKSHLTGEFLTYYSKFTDQIVKPAATEKKVQTTASVVRAAVSDMQPDKATVLAFINQTTVSAERPDPALANSSVLINLTKVDGTWLISEFKPI